MGVLEDTGARPVYVPDRYAVVPSMIGERTDMAVDDGFESLEQAIGVEDGWFLYGKPVDRWDFYLPRAELLNWGNLSSPLLRDFWRRTTELMMSGLGLDVADAIMDRANNPGDGRVVLFEESFYNWQDGYVQAFVGEIQDLLGARNEDDILRDDAQDAGAQVYAKHRTEIRMGWSGAIPLLLVERSVMTREHGQPVLKRCAEAVKTSDTRVALDILNELSLPEEMRVRELLRRLGASPEERRYVLENANRTTIQRDSDVAGLVDLYQRNPETPRWRRAIQGLAALAGRVIDSSAMRSLEHRFFAGRRQEPDL